MCTWNRTLATALTLMVVGAALVVGDPRPAAALEAGMPAPDFSLPATTGLDVSLSDFRGKRWVFLEFYALDFHPA
jgi:hypothetical protein